MKIKLKILATMLILLFCLQSFAYAVSVSAESAILVEVSTGRIIYEKESTKQMFPASTTKMMTAILVIENCDLQEIVTVSETALQNIPSGYVTCDLSVGEEISVNDLLYALMIPSANDAAFVLAEHIAGSVDAFSDMMNNKAREIGCTNTHFVNPNGIHDSRHYSTAYDLYLIAKYCMQNEIFRNIVSTKEYTLPATNKHEETNRSFKTTNDLLNSEKTNYYKTAIGIKTGHTSMAGYCLVSESSRDGLDFISVVLNGETDNKRFQDAVKLFDYGYDNYTLTKVKEKNQLIETVEVENATKETMHLDLIIDEEITVINNKSITIDKIIPEIELNEEILAPINAGDVLGTIRYKVDDIEYSAKLIAKNDVFEKPNYSIFLVIAGIVLLLVAIAILNRKKHKSRKRKNR